MGEGARMRTRFTIGIGLLFAGLANHAWCQESQSAATITLGQPSQLPSGEAPVRTMRPIVARGQVGDPVIPPPPFPGGGGTAVSPVPAGPDLYNKGVVNNDADLGGFWTRAGDKFRRCWDDV